MTDPNRIYIEIDQRELLQYFVTNLYWLLPFYYRAYNWDVVHHVTLIASKGRELTASQIAVPKSYANCESHGNPQHRSNSFK
jgi:hypothetical protein